jgi:mono/diheme cytochrome c family protein
MKKITFLLFAAGIFMFLVSFDSYQGDPWDIPAKYLAMENPTDPSDDDCLDVGKSLYVRHCKSCHGSEGFGDGKKAGEIDTEMPDITTDEYKGQKPGAKYYQSFIGRDDMPNFEKKITNEEDRWCVINYIDNL